MNASAAQKIGPAFALRAEMPEPSDGRRPCSWSRLIAWKPAVATGPTSMKPLMSGSSM